LPIPNNLIKSTAENFKDMPNAVLTGALLGAAVVIIFIAIFVKNPWVKAIVLAYVILP
jgi:hypothetical protein